MSWARDAIFYHLYPLGALGSPARNDFISPPADRLYMLHAWLDHLVDLGATAVYLGPVFESTAHGYDTADYFHVDRRLGDDASLAHWSEALHARGLRLVLDGVFHHVGRDFWAFNDVRAHDQASAYRDWFHLDFSRASAAGDPFWYEGWQGHYDLVKLNTDHPAVREHLFAAVRHWVDTFGIDGLRLDAADSLDRGFQRDLAAFARSLRPDFWLLGEVIHGDYRQWAGPAALDSVTNYELYKALYSSHNDHNYFELGHALQRQFGEGGLYRDLPLYTFADNHDVDRVASRLTDPGHLSTLHALLFTVPGMASLYYGSEIGLGGRKAHDSDAPLRPALDPNTLRGQAPRPELYPTLQRLIRLRRSEPALRHGSYRQLALAHEQLAFLRETADDRLVVAVNAAGQTAPFRVQIPAAGDGCLVDLLNEGETFQVHAGQAEMPLPPQWARVLRLAA